MCSSNKRERLLMSESPKAKLAKNGHGFYLTDNINIAREYGYVVEYEVPTSWACSLMRPISLHNEAGVEYVLSQAEADALVVDHALSITIH
jgi:hypothetical protein